MMSFLLPVEAYSQRCTQQKGNDIYSDTWVASDALGRLIPTSIEAGNVKKDKKRVVGIFYITWHSDNLANLKAPYQADVTKVLKSHPEARFNGSDSAWTEGSYHWGEPELGYFLSRDEYVIRKDISMLADAGVDVLIMDVTNAVQYWDEWQTLFTTVEKMKAEGNKVPQFCFWAYNGPVITVVQNLYDKIYKEKKYKDLWFYWNGKPLLLYNAKPAFDANGGGVQNPNPHYDVKIANDPSNPHYHDPYYTEKFYKDYAKEIKTFFTLRNLWWGYYKWAGKRYIGTEDNWSFGYDLGDSNVAKLTPVELVAKHKGRLEEVAVTPAQHASSDIGKSWRRNTGEPALNDRDLPIQAYVPWLGKTVSNPSAYGIYFQDRWDEAIKADPDFIYLNDWNELTAGKYKLDDSSTFLGRKSPYFFVDQYNAEFNRTISPMKGGYTDNYYMQMVQNIRKYKGVRPIPRCKGIKSITMNADFSDWKNITPVYYDTKGDITHRDYDGYGGNHYTNNSGRNDIIYSKIAVDNNNVNFYVETSNSLSPYTDSNWMLLLIDADNNPSTGWYGYDFIINKNVKSSTITTIMKYNSSTKSWDSVVDINYAKSDKQIEIAVPRKILNLLGNSFTFDFKWADNPADLKDPISLCLNGDTAPNRRFNYRCIWNK
jgi:hypothetical protein